MWSRKHGDYSLIGQFYKLEWLKTTQSVIFVIRETIFKSQFINIKILETGKYVGEGIIITE